MKKIICVLILSLFGARPSYAGGMEGLDRDYTFELLLLSMGWNQISNAMISDLSAYFSSDDEIEEETLNFVENSEIESLIAYNTLSFSSDTVELVPTHGPSFQVSNQEYQDLAQILNLPVPTLGFHHSVSIPIRSQTLYLLLQLIRNNDIQDFLLELSDSVYNALFSEAKRLGADHLIEELQTVDIIRGKRPLKPAQKYKKEGKRTDKLSRRSRGKLGMTRTKDRTLRICADNEKYKPKQKPSSLVSGFSPKKGERECQDLGSPIKKNMQVRITLDHNPVQIISSQDTDFSSGIWAYMSPLDTIGTIALDADDPELEKILQKFRDAYPTFVLSGNSTLHAFEAFLIDLTHFVHDNIEAIDALAVRDEKEEIVCRHYSTYIAILFSKLVSSSALNAYIQVVRGSALDETLSLTEGSHAWNLVALNRNGQTHYWFFDAYNYAFAKLKAKARYCTLKVKKFVDPEYYPSILDLTPKNPFYMYIKLTMQKFIDKTSPESLYSEANDPVLQILADDLAWKFTHARVGSRIEMIKRPLFQSQEEEEKDDCEFKKKTKKRRK